MPNILKSKKAQGLIEYLLLLCLIAATTIGIVSVVGQNIKEQYQKASQAIRGENGKVEFTKPTNDQLKKRGMSDWEGALNEVNRRGAVLVEGIFSTLLSTFALLLLLEIYRLACIHIAADQAAFMYTRSRALGLSRREAEEKSLSFMRHFLGSYELLTTDFKEERHVGIWKGSVHVRYPQFIRLWNQEDSKHHLETTKTCRFPGLH